MACTTPTVYWAGVSFSSATQLYSDAALTTVASDGIYTFGSFSRVMTSGVLGPPQPCPTCSLACNTQWQNSGGTGRYTIDINLGSTSGAAIITFSSGQLNTTTFPSPDQCTWSYNGVTASEYSALVGGYQTGLIGSPDALPRPVTSDDCFDGTVETMTTEFGSSGYSPTGQEYIWDANTQAFVATGSWNGGSQVAPLGWTGLSNNAGTYESTLLNWNYFDYGPPTVPDSLFVPSNPFAPNMALAPNLPPYSYSQTYGPAEPWPSPGMEYRGATMVVPSPPGVSNNILTITVDSPCGSWWGLKVDCPRLLTGIQGSIRLAKGTDPMIVCGAPNQTTYYHVPVDAYGTSNPNSSYYGNANFPQNVAMGQQNGVLGLHDWIYTDENGENPLATGLYKMTFDANDGGGLRDWIVEVGVREYKDTGPVWFDGSTAARSPVQQQALPPEDYANQGYNVQSNGAYIDGIVKSIVACSDIQ